VSDADTPSPKRPPPAPVAGVVEAFAPAEDIVRRCLALALGDDPMYDADSLTGKSVRPARDVAGSEDALDAVLEVCFLVGDAL
jgi:hypothetical protein